MNILPVHANTLGPSVQGCVRAPEAQLRHFHTAHVLGEYTRPNKSGASTPNNLYQQKIMCLHKPTNACIVLGQTLLPTNNDRANLLCVSFLPGDEIYMNIALTAASGGSSLCGFLPL